MAGMTMDAHWRELVTTAMLGTDRRDPPAAIGPLDDLVADTLRSVPSERMLAQVAACTAVRRAGVLPGPPVERLQPPAPDDRPVCVPAAVERWHHITTSWPVLEDEWTLTLITNGRRVAPELVPAVLRRHRSDPVRRARAEVACGPLATWLVSHLPELEARSARGAVDPEALGELPDLPIPPGLVDLLGAPADIGTALAEPDQRRPTRRTAPSSDREPDRQDPAGVARRRRIVPRGRPVDLRGVWPRVGPGRPGAHPPPHARRTPFEPPCDERDPRIWWSRSSLMAHSLV